MGGLLKERESFFRKKPRNQNNYKDIKQGEWRRGRLAFATGSERRLYTYHTIVVVVAI